VSNLKLVTPFSDRGCGNNVGSQSLWNIANVVMSGQKIVWFKDLQLSSSRSVQLMCGMSG